MIEPSEVEAMTDVVVAIEQASENVDFEQATKVRRALINHIEASRQALSMLESDMVRQVERNAKTVHGVTYARGAVKSVTGDHERILSAAYKRALTDATNQVDGTVDWDLLGEAMANIVSSLYLAPTTTVKKGGLDFLGLSKSEVTTEVIKGWKLVILGEQG